MNDDPIVAEIHRIREGILDEAGGDMEKVLERMRAVADAWPGPKLTLEQRRAELADAAARDGSGLRQPIANRVLGT